MALAVAQEYLAPRELEVLDPQPDAFHDPHARTIQQATSQAVRSVEAAKHPRYFRARQHDRQAPRCLRRSNTREPGKFGAEHLPVHEQQSALRLILRGGGDIPRDGQVRQERLDLGGPKLGRVALAVETDEASNPIDVGLLGADAVMLDADPVANTVEQARRERCIHRVTVLGPTLGTFLLDFRGLSHAKPYDNRMMDAFFSVIIRLYIFRWASRKSRHRVRMPTEDDNFFRALESERARAIVSRDLTAIERLHAPEYELITPPGRIWSRTRYIAAIAAEPFYASWECGPIQVRRTPAMAIVRYTAKITFPSGRVVDCWHTDSYELRGNVWQAVWSQATALPTPTTSQAGQ